MTNEAKEKAIKTNTNKIFHGVIDIVKTYKEENGTYPTRIHLPVYLDRRDFHKRVPSRFDAFIYNTSIDKACMALDALRKTNESYDWNVCICDPTGPVGGLKEGELFIDVLGEIYDVE